MIDLDHAKMFLLKKGPRVESPCNDGGFSLLELLVLLGILIVLLAIAIPQTASWVNRYNAEAQIKQIYSDLMNTRAKAMQRNRMHFVALAPGQYTVYEDTSPQPDGDQDLNTANDTTVLQNASKFTISHNLPSLGTQGNYQVGFDPRGLIGGYDASGNKVVLSSNYIRVTTSAAPEYDCINISSTRLKMGKFDGTNCNTK